MSRAESINTIRQQALKFLARREHSRHELQRKLLSKGWSAAQVAIVIEELVADNLQSDERFQSVYVHFRREAGYGPRRIVAELAKRGIKASVQPLYDESSEEWNVALERVWRKKFIRQTTVDPKIRGRQIRFLIYRGFNPEQIRKFLGEL